MILLFKYITLFNLFIVLYVFLTDVHLIEEIAVSRVFFSEIASHIC